MSMTDDTHNTLSTGKCPFHQGGMTEAQVRGQPAATGGQINFVWIF
ncbi:catalase [Salmonella enterica subsp. indica]|uniref:Catalase n=1 Tax=Salmonella enterica subsp. indica TaxID=59207 RepID=A0A379XWB2_SALER|nr:catalase [Salmonella enterica subsp. indica]